MTKFTKEQQKLLEQIIVFHGDGFSVRGSVLGHVWGNVEGDVGGNVWGNVWGDVGGHVLNWNAFCTLERIEKDREQ